MTSEGEAAARDALWMDRAVARIWKLIWAIGAAGAVALVAWRGWWWGAGWAIGQRGAPASCRTGGSRRLARSAGGGMGRAGLFASRGARAASHRCRESALALRPGGVVPPARGAPLSIRIPDRDLRAAAPAQVGLLRAAVPAGGAPGGARGSEGRSWRAPATRAGRLPGTRRRFQDGGAGARR